MTTPTQNYNALFFPESSLSIQFNKIAGTSISPGGRFAGEYLNLNAIYQFDVGIAPGKTYSTNRQYILGVENDMNKGSIIAYSPSSALTSYMGTLTSSQIGQITITNPSAGDTSITINTSSVTDNPSGFIVRKGDYIQPIGSKYPFQATSDVAWSSGSVSIPINRGFLVTSGVTNYTGIVLGNSVSFYVKYAEQNTYAVVPYDLLQYEKTKIRLIEVTGL